MGSADKNAVPAKCTWTGRYRQPWEESAVGSKQSAVVLSPYCRLLTNDCPLAYGLRTPRNSETITLPYIVRMIGWVRLRRR